MVIFLRSNAIIGDSRLEKYISYLDKNNINYHIVGWDRLGDNLIYNNTIYYQKRTSYAVGGLKAAISRFGWMFFCLKYLVKYGKGSVIHACDLDAAFPVAVYKFFFNRKSKIIFDVFDWYSATLANQGKILQMIFSMMEYFTVKYSDYILICEVERIEQIPYDISDKVLVLPNIPNFKDVSFKYKDANMAFTNDKMTLSYVGGFYPERFLDELLEIAEKGLINLQIAGFGESGLTDKCKILSDLDNVHYYGKVTYKESLHIMYNSDIVYAMYCKCNPNHIYAAPNKFYEAMLLGKPIISTKGTLVGDKIESLDFGYVIEEDYNALINIIHQVSSEDVHQKGVKAYHIWNDNYKDYVHDFLNNDYKKIVSNY